MCRAKETSGNAAAAAVVMIVACSLMLSGCRSTGRSSGSDSPLVHQVVCLYDATPWLNLDRSGDLDPEGFKFRVFLDPGTGRGAKVSGMLHVDMYKLERVAGVSRKSRVLVSDWHYPTDDLPHIAQPGMLGDGYFPHLRWADKGLAGSEVDVVVSFEDKQGRSIRAPTKRLKIPKYEH